MAQLSNLIVQGSSRLLSKLYCKDVEISGTIVGPVSISGNLSATGIISASSYLGGILKSSNVTASYINGNNGNALVCSLASGGSYVTLMNYPSTNGYFTFNGYQGNLLVGYTAKTTVTAGTNRLDKQITLLNESGNTTFPGTVTAPAFSGSLSGTAAKATQDSAGQQINTTYIKGLSISGRTITYTKGNGTTATLTTQDTTYPVYGKTIDVSFMTAFRTQTKGNANTGDYITTIRNNTASVANSPQHGSGLAFGREDTHGYLYLSYSSAVAYIGGGNANALTWVKSLAFTDSNVASATKLATARKIGNASFNGTADISLAAIGTAAQKIISNISIAVSSFSNLQASYSNSTIKATQIPEVFFDAASTLIAAKAGITISTVDGKLNLTALRTPTADLKIESLILTSAS